MPYATPYMNALIDLTEQHHNALLIGELYSAGEEGFLNSAQAIGDGSYRYDKKHLVPFGEYLPFYDQLGPILEDLRLPTPTTIPGTSDQIPLRLKKWQTAVMICYEIAYPTLTLHSAQHSNVLITLSNDTWFGNSIGPQQHFQIARTRAIEAGRYLIRATNNGITGFIGPDGGILSQAPQFVATTLTGIVPGMQGRTPLMIYGHLTILLLLLLIVAISSRQTLK
jgi:apolipoprotein N-acyltransferase